MCTGAGDQSGLCSRSRDSHVPVFKFSVDVVALPMLAFHFSMLQATRRDVAFPTYVAGIDVGKLGW